MLDHRLILRSAAALTLALAFTAGCASKRATTQPAPLATDVDPDTAFADYWLGKPATASASASSYEQLFAACEHETRQRRFAIDSADYRSGLITTRPMISKQLWEFWRSDVGDVRQTMNSSLATYRRSVRWVIQKTESGAYTASPWVVVERFSSEPRRITTVVNYRASASSAEAQPKLESPQISRVSTSKWYAIGRDEALEAKLASDVGDRIADQIKAAERKRNK